MKKPNMDKKGVEWNFLLMFILGIAFLLIALGGIMIVKNGTIDVFGKIMEILRFK